MTESEKQSSSSCVPDGGEVTVECPDCGHKFTVHPMGDMTICEECDSRFNRFTNIVGQT